MSNLFEEDEVQWREETIELLEQGRLTEIDAMNLKVLLIEMGNSEKTEIFSRLVSLIMHILKASHQPCKITRGWLLSIREQRRRLRQLSMSKNLMKYAKSIWLEAYKEARRDASLETGLSLGTFPKVPEFTFEQVLDGDWYPASLQEFIPRELDGRK